MTKQERIKRGQEIFDSLRTARFEGMKKGVTPTHVIVSPTDQQCIAEWAFVEKHLNPLTDSGAFKLCGFEFIDSEDRIFRLT